MIFSQKPLHVMSNLMILLHINSKQNKCWQIKHSTNPLLKTFFWRTGRRKSLFVYFLLDWVLFLIHIYLRFQSALSLCPLCMTLLKVQHTLLQYSFTKLTIQQLLLYTNAQSTRIFLRCTIQSLLTYITSSGILKYRLRVVLTFVVVQGR